jgi:hypothetical protein
MVWGVLCVDRLLSRPVDRRPPYIAPVRESDHQAITGLSAWVTTRELASVLGVSIDLCSKWRVRNKLPKPDELVGGRACWSRATVKRFCAELVELDQR